MPDVEITNPKVQIDLASGEKTTVPAGERWKVSLMGDPAASNIRINTSVVAANNNSNTTQHIRTDLFANDTVKAGNAAVRIRGYQVEA